jgi:hypothetical protein
MLEALGLILGGVLLATFLLCWCGYGMIAFSPHSTMCRCDGCQRRRDRAQDRYNARSPHSSGEERHTQAEWERLWEEAAE